MPLISHSCTNLYATMVPPHGRALEHQNEHFREFDDEAHIR